MSEHYLSKYENHFLLTLAVIGLCVMSFFLWPSCSNHAPKAKDPSPSEEILTLRSELKALALAVDNLSDINLTLMDEGSPVNAGGLHAEAHGK